jgi:hypothetical protein
VLTELSYIDAFNTLDPASFVTCIFCIIALELDGHEYTVTAVLCLDHRMRFYKNLPCYCVKS